MFIEKSWMKVPVTQSESRYMSRIIKHPEPSMKLESLFPHFIYSMKISWLFYLQMCQHCVIQQKVPQKINKSPVDSICMQWVLRNLFKRMRKYCLYCLRRNSHLLLTDFQSGTVHTWIIRIFAIRGVFHVIIRHLHFLLPPNSHQLFIVDVSDLLWTRGIESVIPVAAGWSLTLWLTQEIHEPEM